MCPAAEETVNPILLEIPIGIGKQLSGSKAKAQAFPTKSTVPPPLSMENLTFLLCWIGLIVLESLNKCSLVKGSCLS